MAAFNIPFVKSNMKTKVFDAQNSEGIAQCAQILREGGLVAFPTETVYGLGANGFCESAVNNIFAAKGRPNDNPLILHVACTQDAQELYSEIPQSFYKLAEIFWPGPLTLICKKSDKVPAKVCAGLDTVAVRCPANRTALSLIKLANVPVAAPSANISGKPSPTCAKHVFDDMDGKIDAIICGEACKYGIESTVLSLVGEFPVILRPGAVTQKMLQAVLGRVDISKNVCEPLSNGEKALSPGMKYQHYAPDADVFAFSGSTEQIAAKINIAYDAAKGKKIILASSENAALYGEREHYVIGQRAKPESLCASLFAALRCFNDYDIIFCETVAAQDEGLAYMNRLLRACGFKVY